MEVAYCTKICAIQNGIEYDPDSSPDTWKRLFSKVYTAEHWPLLERFNLNKLIQKGNKDKPKRLYAQVSDSTDALGPFFKLAGDTDFNFNDNKWPRFEKLLNKAPDEFKAKALAMLEKCKDMHHRLVNFSLSASTGGLQNVKGCVFDRLDTFVYLLNDYFLEKPDAHTVLRMVSGTRTQNKKPLINYLASFEDIYDYCDRVYFIKRNAVYTIRSEKILAVDSKDITGEDFVKRLICCGGNALTTPEDVICYMELAMDFWEIKKQSWSRLSASKSNKDQENSHI
jgi:hypothetical protein